MVNRWETPHNVRSRVPAWLRLSILAVVVAGVTTAPLHAQPGGCERPAITITASPEPVDGRGGTTRVAFEIGVDVGGGEYCFWEITYQTGGGDAAPGEDYRPIAPRTECRSGNDTVEGSVDILGNIESNKTFEVQVPSILVGGCVDGDRFDVDERATVTIGDYQSPSVSIDDVQIEEGDESTTNAVFTVRVEPPAAGPIAVGFQTENDTAMVSDGDYKAQFGAVTITPVEPYEVTISVPVVGDNRAEEDETFIVLLTRVDGAAITDGEGVGIGTILNDDTANAVRIADAPEVPESAESAEVVVERLDPSADPAQVTVTASGGTAATDGGTATEDDGMATAEEDFTPVSTVVSWPAGEGGTRTVQIPLLDDDLAEGDETIRVTLSDPERATLDSPSAVDLVILDDEPEGEAEGEEEAITGGTGT